MRNDLVPPFSKLLTPQTNLSKEIYSYFKLSFASHRTAFRCFYLIALNWIKLAKVDYLIYCPLPCRIYLLIRTSTSFVSNMLPNVLSHFKTQHFLAPCAKSYQYSAFLLEIPFYFHKCTKTGHTSNW